MWGIYRRKGMYALSSDATLVTMEIVKKTLVFVLMPITELLSFIIRINGRKAHSLLSKYIDVK